MKNFGILLGLLLISTHVLGEEKKDEKSIQLYGFIRNELAIDTYRGVESFNDIFYLLPLYAADGANEGFQSYLTAAATRLGTKITGPELFNAKTSACIEFDFGGITSEYPTLFRMRHAYVNFNWETSSLLVGQTWHPFWGDENYPKICNLNTGAPFQAFNRSPQVRYNYKAKNNLSFTAAMLYENQYTSKGFYDISHDVDKTQPQRLAGIPEFVVGATYRNKTTAIGLLAEYKTILPTNVNANALKTTVLKTSWGATAYARYKKDKLYILAKTMYGQDLAHLTTPGGYGVKNIKANGDYEYTNYNNVTAFVSAVYGKKWQIGGFAGYGKNLGTSEALLEMGDLGDNEVMVAGSFTTVQDMYRGSIHGALNIKNLRFVAEYENTTANYGAAGTINLEDGLYSSINATTNHRVIFLMMYFF